MSVSEPPGRVDAHHHWWNLSARDQPWIDPLTMTAIRRNFDVADLLAALAGTGVDRTVLVQALNDDAETAELLDQAAAAQVVAGVVGWIDLVVPDADRRLARLRGLPGGHLLVGIRHQAQAERDPARWLAHPGLDGGLDALAALGLPFDLMIRPAQFDVARQLSRRHPGVTFVLDHLGKPPVGAGPIEPWAEGIRALARSSNVVCKLSGLVTLGGSGCRVDHLRPYALTVLEAFGPARVMYGSDWPVCVLAADYVEVVGLVEELLADLAEDERSMIWQGTARRVYGL